MHPFQMKAFTRQYAFLISPHLPTPTSEDIPMADAPSAWVWGEDEMEQSHWQHMRVVQEECDSRSC